jgi:hypothetical protein
LSYQTPQPYTVGTEITPLDPTVTGTVTSYVVSPDLPAGLSLDATTGRISGKPTVPWRATRRSTRSTRREQRATRVNARDDSYFLEAERDACVQRSAIVLRSPLTVVS